MWERLDLVESQLFWEVRWDLESKKKLFILAEEEAMVSGNNSSIWHLKAEINILIDWESRVWNQRSRVLWLNKGDSNTKFFHRKSTKRFWRNSILGFKDTNGRWLDQAVDIGEIFIQYYNELFFHLNPSSSSRSSSKHSTDCDKVSELGAGWYFPWLGSNECT